MDLGAILLPASTAERHPAAPADIPQPIMEITATQPVRGASILTLSIAEAKPAPAAVRLPTIMLTIRIATVRGFRTMRCGISAPRRARPVETPVMSMPTTSTRTAMANATIAAQPSP